MPQKITISIVSLASNLPKVIDNAVSTSGENLTLTSKKAKADMLDNAISISFENLNCLKA